MRIPQSGTALGTQWGKALTPEHAVKYGNLLAGRVGCDEEEDVLGCLQRRDATEIVANSVLFGDYDVTWQVGGRSAKPNLFLLRRLFQNPPSHLLHSSLLVLRTSYNLGSSTKRSRWS